MIREHGGWPAVLELLEALAEVGVKSGKSISQVALHWVQQRAGVLSPITGLTLERQQILSAIAAVTCSLDPADLDWLSQQSAVLFKQPGDIYCYERG
jgi:aryl-alcohol dehydrogenase-like predicted oxidoreductase